MKKTLIAAALALAAFGANAQSNLQEVTKYVPATSVEYVYDAGLEASGTRVTATVKGLDISATHVHNGYNRFAVGKAFPFYNTKDVGLFANVAGTYQENQIGPNSGFGVTAGLTAEGRFTKNVSIIGRYEYFLGENALSNFNGNIFTAGLKVKF